MFINAFCTLGFMLIVMLRMNPRLTALALVAVPFLLVSIKAFGRAMRVRGLAAQQAESKVYSLIHQGIAALPLIQSNTRERHEQKRFDAQTKLAQRSKMSQHGLEVLYWFIVSLILSASTAAVTWFGARQVLSSSLTLGELLVFLAYMAQMFEPLNQLSQVGATISTASASTERVFQILDAREEVKDRADARPVRAPARGVRSSENAAKNEDRARRPLPSAPPPLDVSGNLAYDDVCFAYEASKPVLSKVSFEVKAGESVAIIGPSGAGKTTLLNLLPRFFDPATGAVLLEGADLRELRLKDLRSQIAFVLQEPIILPTTVAENIAYGKPSASPAEIQAAARAANAEEFIEKLPMRYSTLVGEGGARLSVGEKQRLNLARAFLKDAPILLMDEPTSALDVESEAQVVASFFELMRGRTSLMIAHRLTTIQRVNKILVVEDGRVTEYGAPDELLARDGYYARVASGQLHLQ